MAVWGKVANVQVKGDKCQGKGNHMVVWVKGVNCVGKWNHVALD